MYLSGFLFFRKQLNKPILSNSLRERYVQKPIKAATKTTRSSFPLTSCGKTRLLKYDMESLNFMTGLPEGQR